MAKLVRQLRKVRQECATCKRTRAKCTRKIDRLTFVIQEIDDAKLKAGEDTDLKSERDLLAHSETCATLADDAYHALYGGGEDEKGGLDLLNQAIQAVRSLEKTIPKSNQPSNRQKAPER